MSFSPSCLGWKSTGYRKILWYRYLLEVAVVQHCGYLTNSTSGRASDDDLGVLLTRKIEQCKLGILGIGNDETHQDDDSNID